MRRKQGMRIVAVVEDRQLERFVRRAFEAFGFDRNNVRVLEDYPKTGKGSGKEYVRDKYRQEIVTFRRKSRENIALVLGTEADEQTVEQRAQALDTHLAAAGASARLPDERVVYWIPRWHVETWGLHLTGNSVDEDTDYHNRGRSIDWREAGQGFRNEYIEFKKGASSTLPSLNRAYEETGRLKL